MPKIRACVFDAYGTVFDFASAAASCRDVLGERAGALTALWRDKQLQYTWLRSLQHRHADLWQITGDSLDYALETLGLADPALRQRLMDLYRTLYFGTVQTMPFARPHFADILGALDFVIAKSYPARGEVTDPIDPALGA